MSFCIIVIVDFLDYSYDDFSNIYSVMVILSQLYQKLSRSLTDFSIVVWSPFKNLSLIQNFSKISMDTKTLQKKSKVYIYPNTCNIIP